MTGLNSVDLILHYVYFFRHSDESNGLTYNYFLIEICDQYHEI